MSKRDQGTALHLDKQAVYNMYDDICTALSNHFDVVKKDYIERLDKYEYRKVKVFGFTRNVRIDLSDIEYANKISLVDDASIDRYIKMIDYHSRSFNRLKRLHDIFAHAVQDTQRIQLSLSDFTFINGWLKNPNDNHVKYNSALY